MTEAPTNIWIKCAAGLTAWIALAAVASWFVFAMAGSQPFGLVLLVCAAVALLVGLVLLPYNIIEAGYIGIMLSVSLLLFGWSSPSVASALAGVVTGFWWSRVPRCQ